jgi:hypothetical protein
MHALVKKGEMLQKAMRYSIDKILEGMKVAAMEKKDI